MLRKIAVNLSNQIQFASIFYIVAENLQMGKIKLKEIDTLIEVS